MSPPSSPQVPPPNSLGQLLISQGLISLEDLDKGLNHKRTSGTRLGQALVDLELVTNEQVTEALRNQGKLTCVELSPAIINQDTARHLGEELSRQHKALAINSIAGVTTVVMEDPADVYALDELALKLRTKVLATFANNEQIAHCLDQVFLGSGASVSDADEEGTLNEIEDLVMENEVDLESGFASPEDEPESEEDLNGPVINIIQAILKEAFEAGASDVHLEPREKTFVVRFRVDGALFDRMTLKKVWARPCVARIKVISNLDIAQRRLPQDGRTQIAVNGRKIDLRIATMPTLLGEGVVIRILDGGRGVPNIDGLGMRKEQIERLRSMIEGSDGVVLAVGPTGSGKTTTLYSLLGELNKPDTKVITLEDPVENQIESICQVNCDAKIDMTFGRGLRAAMRQDPDVILVGEIRDYETASISVQAALTGHIVLSTLHTIGSAETISRMKEMGVEHYLLADTLRGIVAQRLIRVICPICKTEDEVPDSLRKQLGLDPNEKFFKGAGCPDCNDTGYKGRRGIYEVLTLDPKFRDALRQNANVDDLRDLAIQNGMTTLRAEGIYYARAGQTTVSEVIAKTPATHS